MSIDNIESIGNLISKSKQLLAETLSTLSYPWAGGARNSEHAHCFKTLEVLPSLLYVRVSEPAFLGEF